MAGFIVTLLNIPVEKKANRLALQLMEEYGLATGKELKTMQKVYGAYIASYVAQFILQMLRLIQWVVGTGHQARGKNNKD